ncbi:MAG: prolyl oligopeptidase family serine peptidase [Desulfobacterales bacterium]|nr:MAG: prolyl oligopeptidase family serine peptidase [Desulfobacterales bacterium]
MMTSNKILIFCLLFLAATIGCAEIPCYPPDHYAPEVDAPYTAEEVRIPTSKGHVLAGTLALPSGSAPPYPAVVMITGSSPQDRDHLQTRRKPVSYYKPFRQIADAISRNGIAVLRMDDQGVGCSEGGPLKKVTIQERADDNRSGIEYLLSRKEINKERIGIVGLSEGGNIGPMIAASDPSIRALVVMAGSATNGFEIIEYQRRLKIYERPDLTEPEKEQELAKSIEGLNQAFSKGEGSPWIRSFLTYNPLHTAKKVSCPVLILHGDKDAHVPVDHAHLLAKAMRMGGNNDVTVKIFTNHNHLFLKDPDGRMSGYMTLLWHTNKLSEDVLKTITEWLSKHLAAN